MGSEEFSKMVRQKQTRQRFISHAINFIRENNFDGIDLGKVLNKFDFLYRKFYIIKF